MKKKIMVISLLIFMIVIIILGVIYAWLLDNKKVNSNESVIEIDNNIVSTITIDINPSLEIYLNKNNLVVSIKALNEDSKRIISNLNFMNDKIEDVISRLIESLKDNNYLSEKENTILINVVSENDELSNLIETEANKSLEENEITADIVMQQIEETDELKQLAEKNNMTVSKVYYIQEQIKDNEGLSVDDFKDVSLNEIKTKVDTYVKEQAEKKKTEENKSNQQTNNSQKTNNNSGYGSISQCEYVKENFSKEDMYAIIRGKVSPTISSWIGGSYAAYGYLYNGKCTWRMDLVDDDTDHSYIYDITTGEELADITKKCLACTFDQILSLTANYHNVDSSDIHVITMGNGVCGSTESDIDYTFNDEKHKIVFNRYTGEIKSAN